MAATNLELPKLLTSAKDFLSLLPGKDHTAVEDAVKPFIEYENALRQVYAQQREHPAVKDSGLINCVPLFNGSEAELKIRARDLASESEEQQSKYIMPLTEEFRKPDGALATAASLDEFKYNFGLFSENCLAGLDWSNIVAAGSSVLTPLLAIPEKYKHSKRGVRQYYHQVFAPASDIDLFIYGLSEEEAILKMQAVEQTIRDNILLDTVTIRTRHAVTIVSQHPNRHVQIVLRLYDSVSELITGFDVDASAVAYDGTQVWASPRAVAAIVTQVNTLDINRRSPSYENRLAKYAQRGFEVHWPLLDRSKIDPTIFERHFPRTSGLARLLVLERLPKAEARDNYRKQRREERGRPYRHEPFASGRRGKLRGNIKDDQPEDVADWTFEDDYSSYHSFTIPYGPKFDAKRIEKLMYTRDLLLNAEWNKPKDRKLHLHRHPCFIGTMEEVQEDCCGLCPEPLNQEEKEIEEEEHKNFVFGNLTFLKDNPGRQEIGSFHPITDEDFTLMAYIGNTAELCAAIATKDLEKVKEWCSRPGADVNVRDHTGRAPIHLATLTSSPEIVQYLIDQGARIVARLVDGMTALHIAAARGDAEMVSALLRKSEENEELEAEKDSRRQKARDVLAKSAENDKTADDEKSDEESTSDATEESEDYEESDVADDETQGSFVKVEKKDEANDPLEENDDDPDVYDVNILAWDVNMSPLHIAIICGQGHIVDLLIKEFGADPLLPFIPAEAARGGSSMQVAITTLFLATTLPLPEAKKMILTLLKNGCTSAQANPQRMSAFHSIVSGGNLELVKLLCEEDAPHPAAVMNNLVRNETYAYGSSPPYTPLTTAIQQGNVPMALFLADRADTTITYDTFIQWLKNESKQYYTFKYKSAEENELSWKYRFEQPIEIALRVEEFEIVKRLISDADINRPVVDSGLSAWSDIVEDDLNRRTLLDEVDFQIKKLRKYENPEEKTAEVLDDTPLVEADFLSGITAGTYSEQYTRRAVVRENDVRKQRRLAKELEKQNPKPNQAQSDGEAEKYAAVQARIKDFEDLRELLVSRGAKTATELGWKTTEKTENGYWYNNRYYGRQQDKPKPFDSNVRFDIGDITETSKQGYIQLFEAAWRGDLERINDLTTGFWGNKHAPLEIAVKDSLGWSPFFIACFRGHLRLAQHIVEIARMQHHPEETVVRYEIGNEYEYDDYGYYDSDSDDGSDIHLRKRVIDDIQMIENVATIHNNVNSQVKPLDMVNWNSAWISTESEGPVDLADYSTGALCALDYAALYNNSKLFKFLLQLLKSISSKTPEEPPQAYQQPQSPTAFVPGAFAIASKYNRVDMLEEIIRIYGYGVETEANEEGTPAVQSQWYKGLNIGGQKRADWVKNGRNNGRRNRYAHLTHNDSLGLTALKSGAYKSAEFLFGDGPRKCFEQFKAANPEDFKSVAAEDKDKFVIFWGTNKHLSLHAIALGERNEKTLDYVKVLVEGNPELLDAKSVKGFTPLYAAVHNRRTSLAKHLLSLGANAQLRDDQGRTLAHALLVDAHDVSKSRDGKDDTFSILEPEILHDMFITRTSTKYADQGSKTPLDGYLANDAANQAGKDYLPTLRKILNYSKGDDLKIPNDHGDYPLHTAVKRGLPQTTKLFIETCPEILHRENANGQTPLDLVKDKKIMDTGNNLGGQQTNRRLLGSTTSLDVTKGPLLDKQAQSFVQKKDDAEEDGKDELERFDHDKVVKIVFAAVEANPGPRRLVSLFEANALAERLAKPAATKRYNYYTGGFEYEGDKAKLDEISRWGMF